MSEELEYVWTCGVRHTGGDAQRWDLHIRNNWKPIGMWIKPPRRVWWDFFVDMTTGGQQKEGHAWQQAEAEAEHYIRALCPRGGVVCDPMCGSGTTLAVSRRLGHPAIGIDIDPAAVAYAYQRLERCGGFARPKAKSEAHDHW